MAIDSSKPALSLIPCIEVTWSNQVRRYCRAEQNLTIDGKVYTAMPEMDFEFEFRSGGIEDKPQYIIVDLDDDPFDKMILYAFPPTTIRVLEADGNDLLASPSPIYLGEVATTKARFSGNVRVMRVECWGRKADLKDVSLGMKCTDRCPWAFGQSPCGASPNTVQAEVESLNGTVMRLVSLPNDSDQGSWNAGRYTRGYVEFDGLRIMIRKHNEGNRKLVLAQAPPQSSSYTWVGETINITEGCDKSKTACEAWGQQEWFGGIGYRMPEYNPILEDKPL